MTSESGRVSRRAFMVKSKRGWRTGIIVCERDKNYLAELAEQRRSQDLDLVRPFFSSLLRELRVLREKFFRTSTFAANGDFSSLRRVRT